MVKKIDCDWVLRESTVSENEEEKLNDKRTYGGYQSCDEDSPEEV